MAKVSTALLGRRLRRGGGAMGDLCLLPVPWGLLQQRSCGTSTLQETGGGRLAAVPKGTEGAQQDRAEAHSKAAPDKHIGVVCLP